MKALEIEKTQVKNVGRPVQAMPVERQMAGGSAVSGDMGVEASAWWDKLTSIAKTALPLAGNIRL